MSEYIFSAFIFGLTAGFKPGPLGIVVIQQTLEHGLKSGVKASLAPIITDGPIIFAALVLLTQFKDISLFIGLLSFIGGMYLLFLSIKILRVKEINISKSLGPPKSLATAIKVNLLSPNPYLFWFTVGGTYIVLGTKTESIVFVLVSIGTFGRMLGQGGETESMTVEEAAAEWGEGAANYTMGSNSRVRGRRARKDLGWAPSAPPLIEEIERGCYAGADLS